MNSHWEEKITQRVLMVQMLKNKHKTVCLLEKIPQRTTKKAPEKNCQLLILMKMAMKSNHCHLVSYQDHCWYHIQEGFFLFFTSIFLLPSYKPLAWATQLPCHPSPKTWFELLGSLRNLVSAVVERFFFITSNFFLFLFHNEADCDKLVVYCRKFKGKRG